MRREKERYKEEIDKLRQSMNSTSGSLQQELVDREQEINRLTKKI
jgi:hypothetical protein